MAFKRLPNGYGSIDKLPGSRRRPYRARKKVGEKDGKPVYVTIGYFDNKAEALRQLALANDVSLVKEERITFGQCYELWKREREKEGTFDAQHAQVYRDYLQSLNKREMEGLKAIDLEAVINSDQIPRTTKRKCVVILHGVFGYALRHEIISKDYSRVAKYIIDIKTRIDRKIFTTEDIDKLWEIYDMRAKMALVMLYTGMRVSEAAGILKENVHIAERYMVGGLKTEAGRDRIIPIHTTILLLCEELMQDTTSKYLFHTGNGTMINRNKFGEWLKSKTGHSPHETRHTFITQAYKCGIKESDIKRIVGHTQGTITQKVYVHADIEYLVGEIDKLYY